MGLHALLIGIDQYKTDSSGKSINLQGCVNDIDAVQSQLLERLDVPPECITCLASPLPGKQFVTDIASASNPTLANIKAAFEALIGRATTADRVFIHYSGHGTHTVLTDDTSRRYAREALVPRDHIIGLNRQYLFDWELNAYLARLAATCHAATVILDCCNSAGATRGGARGVGDARFFKSPSGLKLADFPVPAAAGLRGVARSVMEHVDKCQVIAACQADEVARESDDDNGKRMGHLTRALIKQLSPIDRGDLATVRWGRIWRSLQEEVWRHNQRQTPWLSGGFARRVFGGDVDKPGDAGFHIGQEGGSYRLDAGTRAGITRGAEIAVYGPEPALFSPRGSDADKAERKGMLRVVSAERSSAIAEKISARVTLEQGVRGRLVKPGDAAKMRVAIAPKDDDLARVIDASDFIDVVDDHADVSLRKVTAGWQLEDDVHGSDADDPELLPIVPLDKPQAARAVLEHYHAYSAPLRYARECLDLTNMLQVSLLDCSGVDLTHDANAVPLKEIPPSDNAPYQGTIGDQVCFAVDNLSDRDLYVTLIDLVPEGIVHFFAHQRHIAPRSQQRFWADNVVGKPFDLWLPDGLGIAVDRIVAIGTTVKAASLKHLETAATFAEVLDKALGRSATRGDRHVGRRVGPDAIPEQWTAAVTALRVDRNN